MDKPNRWLLTCTDPALEQVEMSTSAVPVEALQATLQNGLDRVSIIMFRQMMACTYNRRPSGILR